MSPFSPHYPLPPSSHLPFPWPTPLCSQCTWDVHICSLANSFNLLSSGPPPLLTSDICQFVPCNHVSSSILLVSLLIFQ